MFFNLALHRYGRAWSLKMESNRSPVESWTDIQYFWTSALSSDSTSCLLSPQWLLDTFPRRPIQLFRADFFHLLISVPISYISLIYPRDPHSGWLVALEFAGKKCWPFDLQSASTEKLNQIEKTCPIKSTRCWESEWSVVLMSTYISDAMTSTYNRADRQHFKFNSSKCTYRPYERTRNGRSTDGSWIDVLRYLSCTSTL